METPSRQSCLQCRHYYITWDSWFPYGCRAMQFKARIMPLMEVRQASEGPCQFFSPKQAEPLGK